MCEVNPAIPELKFWRAIAILTKNFHAINKKLSGVKIVEIISIEEGTFDVEALANLFDVEQLPTVLQSAGLTTAKSSEESFHEVLASSTMNNRSQYLVVSKNFFKKNVNPSSYTVQAIDFIKKRFYNFPLDASGSNSKFRFAVHWSREAFEILSMSTTDDEKSLNWFKFVLQPKLLKWAQFAQEADGSSISKTVKSLNLVDIGEYTELYTSIKDKYGKEMVECWPECTDPQKFVYEDVAIAAYIILLWRKEKHPPKNFIDMGCGNGLLVHILNSEGYKGYGIDIRRRKIWDIYPETTKLLEHTIIPNAYQTYSHVDWIIGNHSDELSPWIPVIAAMSSYQTKYFLLPCCAFEFSGRKFQRRNCKASVYNDFLSYEQEISEKCGFITLIDRLKIPSTKRVALVGTQRKYPETDHDTICQEIDDFVKAEIKRTNCMEIKFREKAEPVRNCTKIDRNIIDDIVVKIFTFLMEDESHGEHSERWRCGRTVTLQEIAFHLSKENLKSIKSECGGLKTLIKMKHEIFEVLGDKVKLRYPKKSEDRSKGFRFKRRECFFFLQHPDGCPLSDNECSFIHTIPKK